MSGAIFLDRDGVINVKPPDGQYVLNPFDFHFIDGSLEAIVRLSKESERKIVVVTNQSPIGRGYVSREMVDAIHAHMLGCVENAGGRIDGIYLCPHKPSDRCDCRKPKPGLLRQAIRDYDLDPVECCLVGDSKSDLMAAWATGIRECYLVLTGSPLQNFCPKPTDRTYAIYASLLDAAAAILRKEHEHPD